MKTATLTTPLACALFLLGPWAVAAERPAEGPAAPRADWPCFSGVYPHLAAVADSYSECGIGAVVPWADRLWYVSYVSHKSGGGVGLYEIAPDLAVRKRPESVVGTHAGRMIHRESNQLIVGPYAIDAEGNVRVIEGLTRERVTAVMRHLDDPAGKVYVQAMEGGFYEVDVHTLASRRLFDLSREELGIEGKAHFKGGYTAQGRVVVANNTYHGGDQREGSGGGRLAEWDGTTWRIVHRTAFCDVTTAGGVLGAPSDDATLWAVGWDRASVLLAVLHDGAWSTYRLPKGSQSYDHAWCTEWPRVRQVAPGRLMLDMHGLFYTLPPDFAPGRSGGPEPLACHLRMTPDFCPWQGKLVLAGNELSSLGHRHRTGGQPQSNLWFGSIDEIRRWGKPSGWGGPWHRDEVAAGVPSAPFLIGGFANRTLHLFEGASPPQMPRCTGRFAVVELPNALAGLDYVTVERGSMEKPAPGYSFEVNQAVEVYLAVHDRGRPELPEAWEETSMQVVWQHTGLYTDTIYRQTFPKGTVEIPGHNGHNDLNHYGVPHLGFVRAVAPGGDALAISGLPETLGGAVGRQEVPVSAGEAAFTLEVDRDGTGHWAEYETISLGPGGYARHVLPDDLPGTWMRLVADRDCAATAQFVFGSHFGDEAGEADPAARKFAALSPVDEAKPRSHGALLPFADRLWFVSHVRDEQGKAAGAALYEIDEDMTFRRRSESLPGVFANRKMIAGRPSIGPHLVAEDGSVQTFAGLADEHVVASIRCPRREGEPERAIYFLTADGRLLEGDLGTLEVAFRVDIPKALGLEDEKLQFNAGHVAGATLLVGASAADGRGGCLAEWDGNRWTLVDRAAFAEISNLGSMSEAVLAAGWDRASALVKLRARDGRWTTCRLPKAAPGVDRAPGGLCGGGRPRVREVVTERMLMDLGGLMYEVSGLTYAWSIRPITAHRRAISDFCSWRGLLVLAGADADAACDANYVRSGPDCGLWFGMTDDLWQLGKPAGTGGPWRETAVRAGEPSAPYLMADFEKKRVELSHDAPEPVQFTLEIDPTVQRRHWQPHATLPVPPGETLHHPFPPGFTAHWVRLRVDRDCTATARFVYE